MLGLLNIQHLYGGSGVHNFFSGSFNHFTETYVDYILVIAKPSQEPLSVVVECMFVMCHSSLVPRAFYWIATGTSDRLLVVSNFGDSGEIHVQKTTTARRWVASPRHFVHAHVFCLIHHLHHQC